MSGCVIAINAFLFVLLIAGVALLYRAAWLYDKELRDDS